MENPLSMGDHGVGGATLAPDIPHVTTPTQVAGDVADVDAASKPTGLRALSETFNGTNMSREEKAKDLPPEGYGHTAGDGADADAASRPTDIRTSNETSNGDRFQTLTNC